MIRAFLNSVGMVSALGSDTRQTYANMMAGRSPGMVRVDEFSPNAPCYVARAVQDLAKVPAQSRAYACRNNQLLLSALSQFEAAIHAVIAKYGASRVGVVLGTSTSGIAVAETAMASFLARGVIPNDYDYGAQRLSSGSDFLADYLQIGGPSLTLSTACSSSAHALATGRRLIRHGVCDAVLSGGADTLSSLTIRGFQSLSAISKDVCNPLSRNRDGITIGEGAALFLMTRDDADLELLGAGASSDAHHISAPDPEGQGALIAMTQALTDAGLDANQIDYINLHGTGTPLNDTVECHAIARLFGTSVTVSSTKPLTGHTLGAAGAIELGLCCLALLHGSRAETPPHCWDGERDPALPDLPLVRHTSTKPLRYCLSNSFAFGGNNAALIVGRTA